MKNKIILICLLLWLLYFISYPQDAFAASCSGIMLWSEQILPSLLPYSILSNIIISSQLLDSAGLRQTESGIVHTNCKRICLPVSLAEIFVIVCGMTFGFPIGSKLAADLCSQGLITHKRAQWLIAFTNNMSPSFVSNYVLTYCLNHTELRLQTYLLIYGIPLAIGLAFLCHPVMQNTGYNTASVHEKPASRFHIDMQIIDAGITQSFETLIRLCGYIVIFSILAHIIMQLSPLSGIVNICITGILEVTNGIGSLPTSGLPEWMRYMLATGFLSLGGISGIAQTGSIISSAGLSLHKYCLMKLVLTLIILTAAAICISLNIISC